MTRIDGVPTTSANPLVRLVYRLSRRELGRDVDPVAVYAHAPRLLIGYGIYEKATAGEQHVEERLKVARRDQGSRDRQLRVLLRHRHPRSRSKRASPSSSCSPCPTTETATQFNALEKLVLDYATAISRTPTGVTDELFAALREHFDERQMVELTNVIALENMRARFNSAFDMTPAGFSEGMVCVAPEAVTASAPLAVAAG